jgi:WD40 repeat protein/multidrug efflux pump subunit AcrA (membrane-fusion protein)
MRVLAIIGLVTLLGIGILYARSQTSTPKTPAPGSEPPVASEHQDVGDSRAAGRSTIPKVQVKSALAFHDPIFVGPCHLLPKGEQEVCSPIDGLLQEIVVSLGQRVQEGDALGRLDDRQLRPQLEVLEIKARSQAAELIAKALLDEAETKVRFAEEANKQGLQAVSGLEYQSYLLQRERYSQERKKAQEDRAAAEHELEKLRRLVEAHHIRSGLGGEVTKVFKRKGEMVKQAEPLFRIADHNRLRVEGLCKVSLASKVKVGMPALVEPELRGEPMTRLVGHTAAIGGLAMSSDGRLLASASEDRTVIVWQWPGGRRLATLSHPAEVHAVAFSPVPTENGTLLVTGCADGLVRLWTLTAAGAAERPQTLPRAHESPVRAVSICPEGKLCATGGDDRRIALWDVVAGRHLFWVKQANQAFATAHQGSVTAIHLTSDNHLVSAGRDNTLKLWKLQSGQAHLAGSQPGRTGDVAHLGVSADGHRLLFDHGDELRILDRANWSCVGSLQSRKQGQYQGMALFSPSGTMILTASNNGRLQLWKVPAPPAAHAFFRSSYAQGFHRGSLAALLPNAPASCFALAESELPRLWSLEAHEVRQFSAPAAKNLCGVFNPDESVFFTGGPEKVIHVYQVPQPDERGLVLEGWVTYVGSAVERGTDMVRVRAELDNPLAPELRLSPGTFANLRIYPEAAAK